MTLKETSDYYVQRAEFDDLRRDVRDIERDLTRLDVLVQQLHAQGLEQNRRLSEIADMLHRQESERSMRDQSMRRVIWAANMIGPKSLALSMLLVSILYEWLRRG